MKKTEDIPQKIIRTLVIDDEPNIISDLQLLLSLYPQFVVTGTCGSIADAKVLIRQTKPDLVLLDIDLSDGTCFELLDQLDTIDFQIIFITAYNDKAINAIRVGALDYLVKPIDRTEFNNALARVSIQPAATKQYETLLQLAKDFLEPATVQDRIALKTKNYIELVTYDEILYCQSDGCYTTFYLAGDKKVLVSKPIKEYEALLSPHIFIRTHQSYIVNRHYVQRFHKDGYLVLKTGVEIPVALRKKEAVIQLLTGA